MKRGTKDALWATGAAVALTGLITWREWRKQRDRGKSKFPEIFSPPEPMDADQVEASRASARARGEYR